MHDLVFFIPILLLGIAFYLNYQVYKIALQVYHNDPEKSGRILRYGGERMMREDYDDPFYHNNQKELGSMIQLRTYSLILILASIVLVIVLNFQHSTHKSQIQIPGIFRSEANVL
jgi:hypothetical protein